MFVSGKPMKVRPEQVYFGWKGFEVNKDGSLRCVFGNGMTIPEYFWVNEWDYRHMVHQDTSMNGHMGFHFFRFRRGALNWLRMMAEINPKGHYCIRRVKARKVFKKGKAMVSTDGCKLARVRVCRVIMIGG